MDLLKGVPESVECSVCKAKTTDMMFRTVNFTDEQGEAIEKIFNVNPHTDFAVCLTCMEGMAKVIKDLRLIYDRE